MANEQITNAPFLYKTGLSVSNDATTPNSILDIAIGQCRDSTNVYDIFLTTATTVSNLLSGIGGLDTGAVATSTGYYVYIIADPAGFKATGCIISLNSPAAGGPVMPFGYGIYRMIGWALTDGSKHFLKFYQAASGNYIQWDAPISVLSAGNATSFASGAVSLATAMPSTNFGDVVLQAAYTPNAASDTVAFQPTGGTGTTATMTGQVALVVLDAQIRLVPLLASAVPKFSYQVSSASDAVTVLLVGFNLAL